MIESFRELDVYKRAFKLSVEIHKAAKTFPKEEQYVLAKQLRRSSQSICANIAEGFGRQRASKAEFKRFVIISQGSAHETLVWIDYAIEFKYIDGTIGKAWLSELDIIIKMLHSLYSKA